MKTRLVFYGTMLFPIGLAFLLSDRAGFSAGTGTGLTLALYIGGVLLLRPLLTGEGRFPDRGQLSDALEILRDTPAGVAGKSELIKLVLRQFSDLFRTEVFFLDPGKKPRLAHLSRAPGGKESLLVRKLRAGPRRYQAFARALPEDGLWFPSSMRRKTRKYYRPRGLPGDYFLPLTIQKEQLGVLCLSRRTGFSRRQRQLLRNTAGAIALVLRTSDLRERVRDRQEELRRSEKHLVRMDGMTRSLLHHITREIARPIDEIENNAERLSMGRPETGSSNVRIQKLHLLAHQVSALLEDSLLLVELESGTFRLEVGDNEPAEILREALLEAKMKLPDSQVAIEIDIEPGLRIRADRYLLSSVFYRLFRTMRLVPRRGILRVSQDPADPLRLIAWLELHEEYAPGRISHLNQLYPYLQTFTKTMYKSIRLMGSRLEFPGTLDRILSIRFAAAREAEKTVGEADRS